MKIDYCGIRKITRLFLIMALSLMMSCSLLAPGVEAATTCPSRCGSLCCSSRTTTSIKIKWNKASRATKYQVAYKKKGSSSYKKVTTSNTYKTVKSLKSGTSYCFKVRGYKLVNGKRVYGSWCSVKTYKTKTANKTAGTQHHASEHHGSGVYITDTGTKYHLSTGCRGLNNANGVTSVSLSYAKSHGYSLCGWED